MFVGKLEKTEVIIALFKLAVIYWTLVFGTGVLLGTIRVLLIVPWAGDRTAQLVEMPLMLVAIVLSAIWITQYVVDGRKPWSMLKVGLISLVLMLAAEIAVGAGLRSQSIVGTLLNRDPVSGTAYYLALVVYALMPWYLGRGRSLVATDDERTRPLAGDEIVTDPIGSITHAVTIRRNRRDVWRWLVQMGAGRAGWYSYDFVDNGGRHSSESILPEFQSIKIGALFPALPGTTDAFVVLQYEPNRSLVLGWVPKPYRPSVTTWSFVLDEPEPGVTRLIERGRVGRPYRPFGLPEWLATRLGRLAHEVMVRKHLLGIVRRAETCCQLQETVAKVENQ